MPEFSEPKVDLPTSHTTKRTEEAKPNQAKEGNINEAMYLEEKYYCQTEQNYEISQETSTWLYCRVFSVLHALPHFPHHLQTNPLQSKLPLPQLLALLPPLLENHKT